jgi:hypothetical protein
MVLFCKNLLDMNESDFTTMVATKSWLLLRCAWISHVFIICMSLQYK